VPAVCPFVPMELENLRKLSADLTMIEAEDQRPPFSKGCFVSDDVARFVSSHIDLSVSGLLCSNRSFLSEEFDSVLEFKVWDHYSSVCICGCKRKFDFAPFHCHLAISSYVVCGIANEELPDLELLCVQLRDERKKIVFVCHGEKNSHYVRMFFSRSKVFSIDGFTIYVYDPVERFKLDVPVIFSSYKSITYDVVEAVAPFLPVAKIVNSGKISLSVSSLLVVPELNSNDLSVHLVAEVHKWKKSKVGSWFKGLIDRPQVPRNHYRSIIAAMPVPPTDFIDIGCGDGSGVLQVKSHFNLSSDVCFGYDPVLCEADQFIAISDLSGTLSDTFHYVLMNNVLHHTLDKFHLLAKAIAAVEPGGFLILKDHFPSDKQKLNCCLVHSARRDNCGEIDFVDKYSLSDYIRSFGFSVTWLDLFNDLGDSLLTCHRMSVRDNFRFLKMRSRIRNVMTCVVVDLDENVYAFNEYNDLQYYFPYVTWRGEDSVYLPKVYRYWFCNFGNLPILSVELVVNELNGNNRYLVAFVRIGRYKMSELYFQRVSPQFLPAFAIYHNSINESFDALDDHGFVIDDVGGFIKIVGFPPSVGFVASGKADCVSGV